MKNLAILFLISLLAGCAGVDTLRISSVPEQAKVYVNGEYVALTPCTLSADRYQVLGRAVSGRVHLTIDKEGYKTLEKDVPISERESRKGGGERVGASASGPAAGATYLYTFRLEPLQSSGSAK
jgi:hypothetical protein